MLPWRTATAFCCLLIYMVTHGGAAGCKLHCTPRLPAHTPRCLRCHTFRSKRICSECMEISTPAPHTFLPRVGGGTLFCKGSHIL